MKRTLVSLAVVAALAAAFSAHATDSTPLPKPKPPAPSPRPPVAETTISTSTSEAAATAIGTGVATSDISIGGNSAQGGAGGRGGAAESYSAAGDVSNQTSSKFLNFPQPVWTTVPTPFGCLVSESKAGSFGWSAISGSASSQHSDTVCTTVRMAEAAYLHCQYATAAQLNKRAFEAMYPKDNGDFFLAGSPRNLTPMSCELLKNPTLRTSPALQSRD